MEGVAVRSGVCVSLCGSAVLQCSVSHCSVAVATVVDVEGVAVRSGVSLFLCGSAV